MRRARRPANARQFVRTTRPCRTIEKPDGDTTIVTEVFDCTEAARSIRDAVQDGQSWVPAMRQALERLAAMVE